MDKDKSLDGAPFFQVRITFLNNVEAQQVARLQTLGFPIDHE